MEKSNSNINNSHILRKHSLGLIRIPILHSLNQTLQILSYPLILTRTKLKHNIFVFYQFMNIVKFAFNVFAWSMQIWILGQCDCWFIVTKNLCGNFLSILYVRKHTTCVTPLLTTIYLAFVVDKATIYCFFVDQEKTLKPRLNP